MADAAEILTRKVCEPKNILPTGRVLGTVPIPGTSMCRIAFVDGKGGPVPDELKGFYTSASYALGRIAKFVALFWEASDAAQAKQRKPLSEQQKNAA